jgi:DNA-binding NarL/FixJ family response regulator
LIPAAGRYNPLKDDQGVDLSITVIPKDADVGLRSRMCIRIFLADDHAVVRDGLQALLEHQPDLKVVGTAGDGRQAVVGVEKLRPDVVVMDISMPELNGVDAAAEILRTCPATKIIMLSVHKTSEHIFQALKAGAHGYIVKESAGLEVVQAIRAVHMGRRFLSERVSETVASEFVRLSEGTNTPSPLERLSHREREVLQLVAEGHANSAIATRLSLPVKTVETYRSRLMEKLGVANASGLIRFAIAHGLTPEV